MNLLSVKSNNEDILVNPLAIIFVSYETSSSCWIHTYTGKILIKCSKSEFEKRWKDAVL